MTQTGRYINELVLEAEANVPFAGETLVAGDPRIEAYLEHDVPFSSSAAASAESLAQIERWLAVPKALDGAKALVDVTSIVTLERLLEGDRLSPLTLWDLSRLVTAIVSFDALFHFANPEVDDDRLNTRLQAKVFHTIPLPTPGPQYDPTGVRELWNTAWTDTHHLMRQLERDIGRDTVRGRLVMDLSREWSAVLGRELQPSAVVDASKADHAWNSPGSALLSQLWETTRVSIEDISVIESHQRSLSGYPTIFKSSEAYEELIYSMLRECNYRGMVNQRLANHLRLPYLPNTARLPFRDRLLDVPRLVTDALPSGIAADDRYRGAATSVTQIRGETFIVPVFLALALRRASEPKDLWLTVAELRKQAKAFRRRRTKLDEALLDGDRDTIDETRHALSLECRRLGDRVVDASQEASTQLVTSISDKPVAHIALSPIDWLSTGLTVLMAGSRKLLQPEVAQRVMWRFFKPEFRFLQDVGAESRAITTAMPRVQRIWGVTDADVPRFAQRFDAMRALTEHGTPPGV